MLADVRASLRGADVFSSTFSFVFLVVGCERRCSHSIDMTSCLSAAWTAHTRLGRERPAAPLRVGRRLWGGPALVVVCNPLVSVGVLPHPGLGVGLPMPPPVPSPTLSRSQPVPLPLAASACKSLGAANRVWSGVEARFADCSFGRAQWPVEAAAGAADCSPGSRRSRAQRGARQKQSPRLRCGCH